MWCALNIAAGVTFFAGLYVLIAAFMGV